MLQDALRESDMQADCQKESLIDMQSAVILQDLYVHSVRGQLAAQKNKKNKSNVKLVGTRLPQLLTHDVFYSAVIKQSEDQKKEAAEKETRRVARQDRADMIQLWKVADVEQKERNLGWQEEVAQWEIERNTAKQEKRRAVWKKSV
ncbi:hypothetical protein BKA93DRAFT_744950 [Sparassis latifolia]